MTIIHELEKLLVISSPVFECVSSYSCCSLNSSLEMGDTTISAVNWVEQRMFLLLLRNLNFSICCFICTYRPHTTHMPLPILLFCLSFTFDCENANVDSVVAATASTTATNTSTGVAYFLVVS
jgi:hypothetical protein